MMMMKIHGISEICGNILCTGKLLKAHLKLLHQEFSCPNCDQFFTTKRALERHINNRISFSVVSVVMFFATSRRFVFT